MVFNGNTFRWPRAYRGEAFKGPWGSRLCVLFRVLFPELGTPGVFTTEGEALKGLIKGLGEADFVLFSVFFSPSWDPRVFFL